MSDRKVIKLQPVKIGNLFDKIIRDAAKKALDKGNISQSYYNKKFGNGMNKGGVAKRKGYRWGGNVMPESNIQEGPLHKSQFTIYGSHKKGFINTDG